VHQQQSGHVLVVSLLASLAYKSSPDSYIALFPHMLLIAITPMMAHQGKAKTTVVHIPMVLMSMVIIGLAA